jgi:hypothetical protein
MSITLHSKDEKPFSKICDDGYISINTVNVWWHDSFNSIKNGSQNSYTLKYDGYRTFLLIKSSRSGKIYLIYKEGDTIISWSKANKSDFIKYGNYQEMQSQYVDNGVRKFKIIEIKNTIDIQLLSLEEIKNNNWKIRQHFAILHHTLKDYFAKNKATTTNNAGHVLFNKIFIRHISQFA